MTTIDQLAAALIAAGYGKDGRVNTYAVEQAGVCESGRLSRILRGETVPSVSWVEEILGRIGRELVVRKIKATKTR